MNNRFFVRSEAHAHIVAAEFISASAWFSITPHPDDVWLIQHKPEALGKVLQAVIDRLKMVGN